MTIPSPSQDDRPRAKQQLRAVLRTRRRERDDDPAAGRRLRDAVLALPEVTEASTVAAYVSRPGEPSTAPMLVALDGSGIRVLLPVLLPDLDLDWAADDGSRLPGVRSGVLEPAGPRLGTEAVADADVVVVPALAVDARGRRLGQGGGSYDRALARVGTRTLVVALLHDDELLDGQGDADAHGLVPVAAHDVPVDVAVTPRRTVRFAR